MSPRRKRRSAEVRNSLRLFGLLAVLAGVNVYVFFFNHGTAPREVLKPSSTLKAADGANGKAATLKAAAADAKNQLRDQLAGGSAPADSLEVPATTTRTASATKAKPPVPLAPVPTKAVAGKPTKVAAGGSPPKASPGGSPGQDDGTLPQPQSDSAQVTAQSSPQNSPRDSQPDSQQDSQGNGASQEKQFGGSDTLGQVLARERFDHDGPKVVAALSRLVDPKLIRGGQRYAVRLDEQGEPEGFEYHPSPVTRYVATRAESGAWVATRVDQALETRIVNASGTIEATLYESIQRAGETGTLVGLLVDLLAWDVNFYTDTHPGDHWKVIVEKQYLGGQFYRYGRLLAAEYGGRVGNFRAFYWSHRPDGDGRYYDERGQAISKTLLKTPLRYVRVSSKFDRHRFHPILHREKAHLGIDYAAPMGTPVWASSGGKVVECAMKPGSGNTVVLSHGNGMSTRYYHLARFARGLRTGKVVRQKEVIGFVGTTGLSTGSHLHFSVTKNGAFVDPNKVQMNRDAPAENRAAFMAAVRPRLATLQALGPRTIARN